MPMERPALLVQLQPITPWRCGAGRPEEPGSLVASDSLFGAISEAMRLLGWLPEWLAEGARATRMSSLFPAQGDTCFAPLPEALRAQAGLRKLRLETVRFAPLAAIADLAAKSFDENRWVLDLASGCLLAADRGGAGGPYRPGRVLFASFQMSDGAPSPGVAAVAIGAPGRGTACCPPCGPAGR